MRLEWTLGCRAYAARGSELDVEGLGVDTFWAPSLPADIPLSAVLRFRGTREEFAGEVDVEAYLLGPGMRRLGDLSFTIGPIEFPEGYLPGWEFRYSHPVATPFLAQEWGEHALDFYCGESRSGLFFRVLRP